MDAFPLRLAWHWVGTGRLDPLSAEVVAILDGTLAAQLPWAVRSLDPSADADDAVQALALAQLEAEARGAGDDAARNTARRALWRVCRRRGQARAARIPWQPVHETLRADDGEDLAQVLDGASLARTVGRGDARLVWLVVVDGWSLAELGRQVGSSKQQLWRRMRRALAALRVEASS